MDFEKAIRPLGRFTPMLEKVPQAVRDAVFDIRISVDKPVLLCCGAPGQSASMCSSLRVTIAEPHGVPFRENLSASVVMLYTYAV